MEVVMSPDIWQAAGLAALAALLVMASVVDARQRRVPNKLVVLALALGFLLHVTGPQADGRSAGLITELPGALGFQGALLGALAGLLLFLPFHVLRVLGAGDVKLMAGVGAFIGPMALLNVTPFILIAGGVLAVFHMILKRNTRQVLFNASLALAQMLPGSAGSFDPATQTAWRMPYAVAIAGGLLAYGAWIFTGHQPLIRF